MANTMITVLIDVEQLAGLDRYIEPRGRSEFIRGAIKLRLALEPMLGSWRVEEQIERVRDALRGGHDEQIRGVGSVHAGGSGGAGSGDVRRGPSPDEPSSD